MREQPDPIFRPRRLGHVNLFVDDLERSTRFYNELCGLAIEFTETGLRAQFLGTGNTPHDLGMIETTKGVDRYGRDGHLQIPGSVGRTPALNHIAWEVATEAELVGSYFKYRAAGMAKPRLADHQIAHSIYFSDPDGNPLEFYIDTMRDWRKVLQGEMDLITSVWDPEASLPKSDPMADPSPPLRDVPGAPLHPVRLTHVVIETGDFERLVQFYRRVAGLTVVGRLADDRAVFLRGTHAAYDYSLGIRQAAAGSGGMHHFSFELADESAITEAEARLADRGLAAERRIDSPRKLSLFLRDPDGMRAEFYARRAPSLLPRAMGTEMPDAFEM